MEDIENSKISSEIVKKSEWRMQLEGLSQLNKPLEQWTDEEKDVFWTQCGRLNNLYSTVSPLLDENSPQLKDDGKLVKQSRGWSEEEVAKRVGCGEESVKYCNNSYAHFCRDIREALVENGINFEHLREILNRNEADRELMFKDMKKYAENKDLLKEKINNMCKFYHAILPAVFKLLDSGYTEIELSR